MEIKEVHTSEEYQCIHTLAQAIWREHFTPIIGSEQVEYMVEKFLSEKAIATSVKEGYQFYLLSKNKKNFGFISIHKEEKHLFLSKLYIHKEMRGQHFATKAMDFICEYAKQLNCDYVWLTCNKYNDKTLSIYKHLGFEIFDEAVNDIGNNFVMDDYSLRKWI